MGSGIVQGALSILPPANPVIAVANGVSSGTTVYTVPTGYTFYCNLIVFEATGAKVLSLKRDGTVIMIASLDAGNLTVPISGNPIFVATSGQVITIEPIPSGGGNNTVTISGYIQ